jgi:light-harvesting protein B-800-850 alpha chain
VYAAPAFWLTDYLIAANLQAAYAARAEEAAAPAPDAAPAADAGTDTAATATTNVTLSPEVKQAIAEEVKAQLAAQQAQASSASTTTAAAAPAAAGSTTTASTTPPGALDPANRTFVVDSAVTAVANGTECGLTSGDVVTRLTDTAEGTDNTVNASVSATKKGDCASGATVAIKVDDLQEMYNHFQEQLTAGLGEMAKKQGTNGMPKAPDTGTTASDVPTPKPDPDAAKTLQDQQADADKTEADVKAEASAGGGL